jgi:hypothetical protein
MKAWRGITWAIVIWTLLLIFLPAFWALSVQSATGSGGLGGDALGFFLGPLWLIGMIPLVIAWFGGRRSPQTSSGSQTGRSIAWAVIGLLVAVAILGLIVAFAK